MKDAMTNLKVITVAQENVIDNIMEMECKLLQRNVLNSRAVFNLTTKKRKGGGGRFVK